MIQLKVINEDNFLDAFQLRLADGQEKYVSNPIRSLAQAYVYRKQCQPFGDSNRAMVVKQEKCYTSKARGCSTAIVFTRYILIEWLRRKKNDQREDWENIYDIAKEADRRMYESKARYYRDSGIDRRK